MHWPQKFVVEVTRKTPNILGKNAFWDGWECLRRGMSAELRRKPERKVLSYAKLQASEHWWEYPADTFKQANVEGRFSYWFDDEQGNASVYCGVVPHWMELILGLRYEAVCQAYKRVGYLVRTPQPDPVAIATRPTERPLITVQKHVCQLVPSTSPSGWKLDADLDGPAEGSLSAADAARCTEVFQRKLCACDLCSKLRNEKPK